MRVLVTGHLGYIGGSLVPMLIQRGHHVIGCDVDFFRDCFYQAVDNSCPNLAFDVRDLGVQVLKAFDAVIHLAGLSNDPLGNFDPALTQAINERASVRLAHAASEAGVRRFLFASSCSNYGASDGGLLTEEAPFNPQTAYGHSKVNAEIAIQELVSRAFEPCSLRAGTVYGVAPKIRFDLVVNNLTAYAVATHKVVLKSDGQAWRPLVHVSDVARAYVAALEAPAAAVAGESFNVGKTNQNYQIAEVAQRICDAISGCQIEHQSGATTDSRNYRVNCDKIVQYLPSFQPEWDLHRGIAELVETFAANPIAVADFEGSRFNRLMHLQRLIVKGQIDSSLRMIS